MEIKDHRHILCDLCHKYGIPDSITANVCRVCSKRLKMGEFKRKPEPDWTRISDEDLYPGLTACIVENGGRYGRLAIKKRK